MRELKQNWLDIFRAFRIVAFDPYKIMLGFVGTLISIVLVILMLLLFTPAFPNGITRVVDFVLEPSAASCSALADSILTRLSNLGWGEVGFLILNGILLSAIWAFFGGAIVRSAAVQFARDESVSLEEVTGFAKKKFKSLFLAPIVPLLGIAFFLVCILIGGVIGRIPYLGPLLVGLFFILPLLAGFLIVLMGVGLACGGKFMWPTICAEGTDAFDGLNRAYSYVYDRPWRYVWYNLVGAAYWVACVAFVAIIAALTLSVAIGGTAAGMGRSFEPVMQIITSPGASVSMPEVITDELAKGPNIAQQVAGVLIKAVIILVWGLVAGFAVSMCFTIDTIIYSLLRKNVDGTDMTEVFIEEVEEEEEGPMPPTSEEPTPAPQEKAEEAGGEEQASEAENEEPGDDEAEEEED